MQYMLSWSYINSSSPVRHIGLLEFTVTLDALLPVDLLACIQRKLSAQVMCC